MTRGEIIFENALDFFCGMVGGSFYATTHTPTPETQPPHTFTAHKKTRTKKTHP